MLEQKYEMDIIEEIRKRIQESYDLVIRENEMKNKMKDLLSICMMMIDGDAERYYDEIIDTLDGIENDDEIEIFKNKMLRKALEAAEK